MREWWRPSVSENIKATPWLSPEATAYFESILKPEYSVCEFGGGGSTLWLQSKVKSVYTCEPNTLWCDALNKLKANNVKIVNTRKPPVTSFDMFFIDGEPVEDRAHWINRAIQFVNKGGWIILDNANRPEYASEREKLQGEAIEYKTINANKDGTQFLVTDFYRMP